jgi:hypothetical protein
VIKLTPVPDPDPDPDPFGLAHCHQKMVRAVAAWRTLRASPATLASDSPEVRGLALYAEAAEQLQRSPFFGEDDVCVLQGKGEPPEFTVTGAKFGSAETLKSTLAPFRRIWMQEEDSNFARVCQIIQRFGTNEDRVATAAWQKAMFHFNVQRSGISGDEISARALIDLWIYTQFAHGGTAEQRRSFDSLIRKFGHPVVEFSFRNALKSAGMHFINLLTGCVSSELAAWRHDFGLEPNCATSSAFGVDGRTALGDQIIVRSPSGSLLPSETTEQRFARLIERRRFAPLKNELFRAFRVETREEPDETQIQSIRRLCSVVSQKTTFVSVLHGEGVDVCGEALPENEFNASHSFVDDRCKRRGVAQWRGRKSVVFKEHALEILEEVYASFRNAFVGAQE